MAVFAAWPSSMAVALAVSAAYGERATSDIIIIKERSGGRYYVREEEGNSGNIVPCKTKIVQNENQIL